MQSVLEEPPLRLNFRILFKFAVGFHSLYLILNIDLVHLIHQHCVHPFVLKLRAYSRQVQIDVGIIFHSF